MRVIPVRLQAVYLPGTHGVGVCVAFPTTYFQYARGTRLRVGLLAAASVSILNSNWYKT